MTGEGELVKRFDEMPLTVCTDRENALPATVYRDILNTGQSRVHMGNVVNSNTT